MNTQKSNQQQNQGSATSAKSSKTIVLVHGGFVDGSGWAGVHKILKNKGYNVLVVQNPTKSLADDLTTTKAAIDSADSEVVLVGHSYGGVVITEAGTHPNVSSLVYITAFAPDQGESVSSLIANPPPGAPVPPILPPRTVISSSTVPNSRPLLLRTLKRTWPRSWPIPRCLGAWMHLRAQSRTRLGRPSRATIWSPRKTR
jgi:pimeloyl-ACP methyl ester carboxylesterase